MVIVLPGKHFTVGVIPIQREKDKDTYSADGMWRSNQTKLIIHITIICSGIYLEDRNARRDVKIPIMRGHQVWQESLYLRENGGISEHLISFSLVQGLHFRFKSCLWERPVICAAVHISITTQFHFAYKHFTETELYTNKILSHCNTASDRNCKGFFNLNRIE